MEFVKSLPEELDILKNGCKQCGDCTNCDWPSGNDNESKKVHSSNNNSKITGL